MQGEEVNRRNLSAVIALCAGNCIASVDTTILSVALPTISHGLGVPTSLAVLLVTAYQLMLLMTLLPFAALGEKFGLRRVYQSGQVIFAIACVISFLSDSLPLLLAARICQSLGVSAIMAVSPALIRHVYPPERLGFGLSLNAFIITLAVCAAPTIGGLVLTVADWHWVFLIALPLILLSLPFGRALPKTQTHDEPYDFRAAVMSAGMFFLIFGGIETGIHHGPAFVITALLITGGLLGTIFIRREKRSSRPVFPVDLLARPPIALATTGIFLCHTVAQTLQLILPFRLEHAYGFSPAQVGVTIAAWPFAVMIAVPLAGWLSDRVSSSLLGAVGMMSTLIGATCLAFLPLHPSQFNVGWRLWLCGVGYGFYIASIGRSILSDAPRERMAAAGGLNATWRLMGQTMGASLTAALLAVGAGVGRLPPLIAAGMAVLAGAMALFRMAYVRRLTPARMHEPAASLADGPMP